MCSGAAGLIYEVSWTRLLTLSMGHTTAAASTVVAAFMGGLAVGAAVGGRVATRLTPAAALYAYAALEVAVALIALALGRELALLTPLLKAAYADGQAPILFPLVRLTASLLLLSIPAAALGATYPLALRGSTRDATHAPHQAGVLYAANTVGASAGAFGAGFVLLPTLGLFRTTLTGVAASLLAAAIVLLLARRIGYDTVVAHTASPPASARPGRAVPIPRGQAKKSDRAHAAAPVQRPGLAAALLAMTGFATFLYEIAWTRVLSLIVGPSTYAFSLTLTAVIAGTAIGSVVGTRLASRLREPAVGLILALGAAAVALGWSTSLAGGAVPHLVMRELVESRQPFASLLLRHALLVGALILPVSTALGAAFSLALELVGVDAGTIARRVGAVYAVSAIGSVTGSLTAAFLAIPVFGLERTLWIAVGTLAGAAVLAACAIRLPARVRTIGLLAPGAAVAMFVAGEGWNRELLASGGYKYARSVPRDVDLETALTAGSLLYYRDGAVATVSVKRLTGDLSMSVDGKVDASTSGDMLTQKLLAHLPLLLHPNPRDVAVVGLGSGVTVGAALRHPIGSVDVIELSPEVVVASRYFDPQNHHALQDARTRLIVGDARSHMLLGSRQYDVLISEPSNPWMTGVAALFTREFFEAMRRRLAPGGLVCQWAHTYDIADADLRSIVATFSSVFPNAVMWLIGESDLLLMGGDQPLEQRVADISSAWQRPGVAQDLAEVGARDPFALLSMFLAGPEQLRRYTTNADVQRDDRVRLEFSGPAGLYDSVTATNVSALRRLLNRAADPPAVAAALAHATAAEWRNRAAMMARVAAYDEAFDNYRTALRLDAADTETLSGIVSVAVAAHREGEAVGLLTSAAAASPDRARARMSLAKLLAARGAVDEAIAQATQACRLAPSDLAAWEQLASIFSDAGDAEQLDATVDIMRRTGPRHGGTLYYAAASHFLRGRLQLALEAVQEAIAVDPSRAAAHNLLGAIDASMDNPDAARRAFAAALDLDPHDTATYTNLALLELNANDPSAASHWFAEALSLDPASGAAKEGLLRTRNAATRR